MDETNHIPVIDFDNCSLRVDNVAFDEKLKTGKKIKDTFSSVGFCYLKNHGVELEKLEKYLVLSKQFFDLPLEEKQKFERVADARWGWTGLNTEVLNPERPGDLKEAFNFHPADDRNYWLVPEFKRASKDVFDQCKQLTERLCDVLSVGLGLRESFIREAHALVGKAGNSSTILRTLYYPPLPEDSKTKPGQLRLGEHSDFGTFTLLYQDSAGGLEVKIPGKGFVPATPIPRTMIVNIGECMQRWTSDKLIATAHRVIIPETEAKKRIPRQSMAFFVATDDDYVVECLDSTNKYEPTTTLEYMNKRFGSVY